MTQETIIGTDAQLLDHGFVKVVDIMGDDAAIAEAARVSYGTGTKTVHENTGLIRYLMRHRHTSPFEMCEIKFHIKMPIFVARQWIRHRMANVNEYSARFSVMNQEFYVPKLGRLSAQDIDNKQGSGEALPVHVAQRIQESIKQAGKDDFWIYDHLLEDGLSRELARGVLSVNTYTEVYWKIDLHNLFHFLQLRMDKKAQYEIRVYADAIYEMVKKWVPAAAKAFEDYRLNSVTISGPMFAALQRLIQEEDLTQEETELSNGEWKEFGELAKSLNL